MDRYLFRGKCEKTGKWAIGKLAGEETDPVIQESLLVQQTDDMYMPFMQLFGVCVDPDTVGQCTGSEDENEALIFDGDIIDIADIGVGVVVWMTNYYGIKWVKRLNPYRTPPYAGSLSQHFLNASVIGNIHDNPELLN